MHVRRGDYLNLTHFYEQINNEYYREAIKHYLDVSDEQLKVCIMEKKGVNIKDNNIRDGIHGVFHEICTSSKVRHLIRNYVVNKANESQTFEGFNKKVNEIFDKAIINTAPWLMYGCKKPEGNAYHLTKVLDSLFNDYGSDALGDNYQRTKIFSIQQKVWCEENVSPYGNGYSDGIYWVKYVASPLDESGDGFWDNSFFQKGKPV